MTTPDIVYQLIPNEPGSPFHPSGVLLGTPLVTTGEMKEAEMIQIGQWIAMVVKQVNFHSLQKGDN